jgi:hypothetical protein
VPSSFLRAYADEFLGIPDPVIAAANEAIRACFEYEKQLQQSKQQQQAAPQTEQNGQTTDSTVPQVTEAAQQDDGSPETIELELELVSVVDPEQRKEFHAVAIKFFSSISEFLVQQHQNLRTTERQNHTLLQTKGEVST